MKRIVCRPVSARRCFAASSDFLSPATLLSTPLDRSNALRVASAMTSASDVFPHPGGPYRMMLESLSARIALRSSFPSPRMWSCPTMSSSDRGLILAASGLSSPPDAVSTAGNSSSMLSINSLMPSPILPQLPPSRPALNRAAPCTIRCLLRKSEVFQ